VTDVLPRLTEALADRYRLERELGQGGMATVYLAQDIRHNRRVAVKVLRPELAAVIGAERFLSEITTTANLQHPHILPLFDSGEADGFLFYVMPYVEGETVRDRISREKQLPVGDAVRITTEVAAALDYAHRHGVIHRDIKPENILLHDGSALVADFGIALAVSTAGTRMTETGMSLGTPHYMSPEQAMGEREITARSDVYALGCVLYEMLTGDPPFTGSTAQAIVARVVTETPRPMLPQRQTIPLHVEAAVLTSLQKLPADRFKTAAEFAEALADSGYTSKTTVMMAAAAGRGRWSGLAIPLAVVAAIATIAALWGWMRPEPPRPVARYGLGFPDGQAPTLQMALSPDGARLAYVGPGPDGQDRLWIKERAQYAGTPLAGTEAVLTPTFSPDGQWVAFDQLGQLRKMPIIGGAAITLADSTLFPLAAWLDDGTLVFSRQDFTLGRVSEAGGTVTVVWRPDSVQGFQRAPVFPTALPGARGVLFSLCTANCAQSEIWVLDLKSGDAHILVPNAVRGWYLPSGQLVYARADGSVLAAPFDLKRLEMTGASVPVLDDVAMLFGVFPNLTFSASGTMLMQVGNGSGEIPLYEMAWIDRTGRVTQLDSSWTFRHSQSNGNVGWSLSPDGRRLAIGLNTNSGDDIWIRDLVNGTLSRLTFDSTSEERPRWTPDGKSVTYIVDGLDLLRQRPADGTGKEQVLIETSPLILLEGSWSADGKWLLLRVGGNGPTKQRNILAFQPGVDSAPQELLASSQADESAPALSPDGKWLAYASDETGRSEVYIRPFPNVDDGKWQVSTSGGQAPLWAHSGRELFYVDAARNMMMVPVPAAGPSQMGARVKLFTLGNDVFLSPNEWYTPFDISPDDKRFLMSRLVSAGAAQTPTFLLVENWFEEVKAKVGKQ
ncbi:MAG TPA: protein kinase, partial [Gemmatimonadales bacterium]|nr:protein kinase [Gemmatimonadales bacterium]